MGAVTVRAGSGIEVADGAARGGVPEIQRARIVAALVEVARQRGVARVTVAHVVACSGVSRRTFYEMFDDRDACFVAAFDEAIARAAARVLPAFGKSSSRAIVPSRVGPDDGPGEASSKSSVPSGLPWRERVRAGLLALLEFLDEEPGLGGLCVVDALGAGPVALERRARVVCALVDAVDQGRAEAKTGLKPSRLTAEGVVGGVLAVLYARLADGSPRSAPQAPMIELLNPLMAMIVLPYLGPAAAGKETTRVTPKARPLTRRPRSNPLEGLEMRLTYRTVRVLIAVASQPRASNRQIADAAGVQDQGQISKLLARLEHLGLVENGGGGPVRGEPNAWLLTSRGREVELSIRQQSAPVVG